jgi:hypothetical protein
MLTTQQLLTRLSYGRYDFVNRVECQLIHALHSFYRSRLAQKNGKPWRAEYLDAKRTINTGLTSELLHPIRGFNRRIGYAQAVAETRSASANIRRSVELVALRDKGQAAVRAKLDAKDTAAFWDLVRSVVEPELMAHARRAAVFAIRQTRRV